MKPMRETLDKRFPDRIRTIDSHTAGEPTRLVFGFEAVSGNTMADKLAAFQHHLDDIRLLLTREPRGHRDLLAAVVTDPVTPGAAFGLIYMDARRYPYLCGHATIGAVTTLIESGVLPVGDGEHEVVVDTPSGPVAAMARVSGSKVASVAIQMVPSFVQETDLNLDVPGTGRLNVDLVCVGGFFAMVSSDQINMALTVENSRRLIDLGMAIIDAANTQLTVAHPTRPEVCSVDVTEFYDSGANETKAGKSVVVYGQSHMDRCPCGTGTAAKMTLLHHHGRLNPGKPYVNHSPLNTTFEGRIVSETMVGDRPAVIAEIRGSAHITGIHEFVIDSSDPFPQGYLL
jgi:proline racemase